MSAIEALTAAKAARVEVRLEGGRIKLKARRRPPDNLLKLLEANKRGILAVLLSDDADWSAEDWRAYYGERLMLAERDYPRPAAKLIAHLDTADRWLAVNPPPVSDFASCSHCNNEVESAEGIVVAGANGKTGVLHAECAPRWQTFRNLHARAAVARLIEWGAGK